MKTLKDKAEYFYKHIFMKFESQVKGLEEASKIKSFPIKKILDTTFKACNDYLKDTRQFLLDNFGIDEEEDRKEFEKQVMELRESRKPKE